MKRRVVRKRRRMRVKRGEGRGSWSITVANVILLFARGSSDNLFKNVNLRKESWNQSSEARVVLRVERGEVSNSPHRAARRVERGEVR